MNDALPNATGLIEPLDRPARPGLSGKWLWLTVAASAGTLFLLTAQRGPAWQDSGIFQWRMHDLQLTWPEGLALSHPLLIVLGRLAGAVPLGPLFWRFNAVSAIAAAVATANLTILVRRLGPRVPAAAVFAGAAFALAHTVWWLATIAESHALLAAIVSAELLALAALLKRPRLTMVALLGLLNGLALATHNLALLALPAYGLAVVVLAARGRLRWWSVGLFVAAWAAGASLLIALVAAEAQRAGLSAAVGSALFGSRYRNDVVCGSLKTVPLGLGFIVYNFPNLALPLAAVGLWRLRRRLGLGMAAALGYILAAHFLFAVRYSVHDQFMFFVPLYLLLSLLAGLGLAGLRKPGKWARAAIVSLALGPIAYAIAPAAAGALKLPLPGSARTLPYRDHARYWLSPWKLGEDSAGRFAAEAIDQLSRPDAPAILFADTTSYWPLRWVLSQRPAEGRKVQLMQEFKHQPAAFWAKVRREGATVWVVSNVRGYCPAALLEQVEAQPVGVLYRVRPPLE